MDIKGTDITGFYSSCPDKDEKDVLGNSSKSDRGQDFGSCSNSNVSKFFEKSATDRSKTSSPPKDSLKSTIEATDSNLTQKISEISTTEYPEGAATAASSKILNSSPVATSLKLNASHPSSNVEVATPTVPSVLEGQVLSSSPKPARITSNAGSERSKTSTPLFTSPSKTFPSDLSCTVFREATPVIPKGTFQTDSSEVKNDRTCEANKSSRELPAGMEHIEVFFTTKNQQRAGCWNTSNRYIREDPVTKTPANHTEIFDVSGCDYKENPDLCSIHQQNTAESRRTSKSMASQILQTNMSGGTTIQKTLKVSNKESEEDLFVAIRATSKSVENQTLEDFTRSDTEQKRNTGEAEPNPKSSRPLQGYSLIGEPETKLGSFTNHTKSSTTQKTNISTKASKKRDNLEINNSAKTDPASFTLTANLDGKAETRSSADLNQFDLSSAHSCPHSPPGSSSLLFLPPSSTSLIPSSSVVTATCPATSGHLTLGMGFHPGTHHLR